MALTIGELVGYIRADGSDFDRNLARSQLRMEGFRLDVNGRLRDIRGRFVQESQVMGRALADGFSDAERAGTRITTVYSSVADAQSRTTQARFNQLAASGRRLGASLSRSFSRFRNQMQRLPLGRLKGLAAGFAGVAMAVAPIAAKIGLAVPVVAALVATLANIAPAAALGVSALLALKLATATLKLGMTGVKEAVGAALDPAKAEEFEKAIAKLSPSARAFAREVKSLAPEFKKLQQDVQEKLFKGFDKVMKDMGTSTLPVLRKGLLDSAGALNKMGKGVGQAVIGLSKDGTLGTALKGASDGLSNLSRIPGQLVTGLGQVAAAAAPAFSRLTKAAGEAFDRFSEQFTHAFESGALEDAIEQAIDLIGQIGQVAGNVFKIIGSVFKAAQVSGGGFIGTLQEITGSLVKAFASPEVQGGLKAIFKTMAVIAETVAPLLVSALKAVGPVFEALGPPLQTVVRALGKALTPVIEALGPVLKSLATAFGSLIVAISPLLVVAGDLIAALLPALIPLFDALNDIFVALAPTIAQLGTDLAILLVPLLEALGPILEELLPPFVQLAQEIFPQLTEILVEMAPDLLECAEALVSMFVELAPLVAKLLEFAAVLLANVLPAVGPLIVGAIRILAKMLSALASIIERYVMPAIRAIVDLLQGDFSGAAKNAGVIVENFKVDAANALRGLVAQAGPLLVRFVGAVGRHAQEAGGRLVRAVTKGVTDTVSYLRGLPGRIARSIPNAGSILHGIGRAIIRGLINGISSQVGALQSKLGGITSMIPSWKGPESVDKKLLVPAGRSLMGGLMGGIAGQIPALRTQLGGITGDIPGMAMGAGAGGGGGAPVVLEIRSSGSPVDDFLVDRLRKAVWVKGGGNVQLALGRN